MEKLFISGQNRHLDFYMVICKVFSPFCTLTWRVNNYISRQGKRINGKNEGTDGEPACGSDDDIQFCYFLYEKTVREQFDFSSVKNQPIINHQHSLFRRKEQLLET